MLTQQSKLYRIDALSGQKTLLFSFGVKQQADTLKDRLAGTTEIDDQERTLQMFCQDLTDFEIWSTPTEVFVCNFRNLFALKIKAKESISPRVVWQSQLFAVDLSFDKIHTIERASDRVLCLVDEQFVWQFDCDRMLRPSKTRHFLSDVVHFI